MRYLYIIFIFAFLLAVTACHKDTPSPKPSTAELLTKSPWILKGDLFDLERDGSFVDDLMDCERGDSYVFRPDSVFEFHDNIEICNPGGPTLDKTGTWELRQHDSVMYVELQFWGYRYRKIKISEDSLELHVFDTANPAKKDVRILTFTH